MHTTERPFVGRQSELRILEDLLPNAVSGPRTALLVGEDGIGRRRLVTELMARAPEHLGLRWSFLPSDDAVTVLLKMHGGVASHLARAGEVARPALTAVREQAGGDRGERLDAWYEGFLSQLDVAPGEAGMQLKMPQDNPYWGLVRLLLDIVAEVPTIFEVQRINGVCSPAFWAAFGRLYNEVQQRGLPVMWVLSTVDSPYGEDPTDDLPTPSGLLHRMLDGRVDATVEVPALDVGGIQALLDEAYRPNDFGGELATRLLDLSGGNTNQLNDLLDVMESDEIVVWDGDAGFSLQRQPADLDLESLVPQPDLDDPDLEGIEDPDEIRALADRVLYAAALEGPMFTAGAIAAALGADRDAVDDLLDEFDGLISEVSHHEGAGSWLYRFDRALYHRHHLASPLARDKKLRTLPARYARVLLERFVPASYGWIPVTARLFRDAGQKRQARNLLSLAMGSDRLDLSRHAIEMVALDGDDGLAEGLLRLLHAEPAERAAAGAPEALAQDLLAALDRWARERDDRGLLGYADLLRSKLALRTRDLDGAIAHAETALEAFRATGETVRAAETLNQLAILALHRRDAKAAAEYVDQATRASNIPPVKAHALFIRGLLRKGQRKLDSAASSFAEAARTAQEANNPGLGIEARINQGEILFMLGRPKSALEPLRAAHVTARAMRSRFLERSAASLLSQAEAAAGNGKDAYDLARDALELTRHLNLDHLLATDLYHCGMFAAAAGESDAGREYLEQAEAAAQDDEIPLLKEIAFHRGQLALMADDVDAAEQHLQCARTLSEQVGDAVRTARATQALGLVAEKRGDRTEARALYLEAAEAMTTPALQRERAAIQDHIKEMERDN